MEIIEKILKGIFVGGLSLSAFLMGEAYGIFKTNKEYQKIIELYKDDVIKKESEIQYIREEVTEKLKNIREEN